MGIKVYLSIFVFILSLSLQANTNLVLKDDKPFQKSYKVLIMLPFCVNAPDKGRVREKMLDYYEGVEIAIEELKKYQLKLEIEVVDTKGDSLEVIRLLSNPNFQNLDLIIGPVFDNEFVEVEKFCSVYKIPLISPLRYYPKKNGGEFPLINFVSLDSLQYMYTGQHAAQAFKNYQVVVYDELALTIKGVASRNFKKGYELANKSKTCTVVDGKVNTIESVWNKKDSLLIFYTGKSARTCSNAISKNGNSKWVVAGPADWLDIDRVDYNVFNGVYFYDTYSVPMNDTIYKQFRLNYRENYGGDPSRYTFIGYDQFLFIAMSLGAFDVNFYNHILGRSFNYTHTSFKFVKRGNLIENSGTNLFYYKDYQFYKAYWRY
jgi:ABC-type branched-subunit amino acid transport system substrate-binding protein